MLELMTVLKLIKLCFYRMNQKNQFQLLCSDFKHSTNLKSSTFNTKLPILYFPEISYLYSLFKDKYDIG